MFDDLFAAYDGECPGAAVAVVREGEVVFRKGYGLADLAARVPVTPATNFRLASVTKPFIAEALGVLVARGALSYDDPIARWFAIEGVTVRQLLTHTSGLAEYERLIPASRSEQVDDAGVADLLERAGRVHDTRYRYNNGGYVLLGLILERVSGLPLGELLRREIFAPYEMRETVLMDRWVTIANRAYGHPHDQSVTSATRGDGAIYSSVDDLARWRPDPEGLAWSRDATSLWHSGDSAGFRNAVLHVPNERLTIVILTNRDEGDPLELARRMR